jgi:hypothetical protein
MEKKIINDELTSEKVEITDINTNEKVEEVDLEEWQMEYSSDSEYIQAAAVAMSSVDSIDTALLTKADEQRVKRVKRQGLRIISECLNNLYNEIFDDSTSEPSDTDQL